MSNTRQFKKELWEKLYKAQRGICIYCGEEMLPERSNRDLSASLDHIKPREKGGNSNPHNLILSCRKCNMSKGTEYWESWWRNQKFYSHNRKLILSFYMECLDLGILNFLMENREFAHFLLDESSNHKCLNFLMKLSRQ